MHGKTSMETVEDDEILRKTKVNDLKTNDQSKNVPVYEKHIMHFLSLIVSVISISSFRSAN